MLFHPLGITEKEFTAETSGKPDLAVTAFCASNLKAIGYVIQGYLLNNSGVKAMFQE